MDVAVFETPLHAANTTEQKITTIAVLEPGQVIDDNNKFIKNAKVTLYYFEDLSYVEIAELLNQPIGTVKAHVHRALRLLHKALDTQTNGVR